MLGEPDKALAIALESAQQLDRDSTDPPAAVFAHSLVSIIASSLGDPIARPEAELALSRARESANPTLLAGALYVYAIAMEVIGDDPAAALGAADESITLGRHGASPTMLAAALVDAARMRIRTGDLPRAARDVREGIERSHQSGTRITFYSGVRVGTGILIGADELEEAAVFDGIAGTFFTPEYLASAGTVDWTHLQDAIASARTAYRPDHYDVAFQTGAQMNYDQAVEHTLRVLDDVIKETSDTHSS